jgi:YesN/AraC family two-component response regulator
MEFYQANLPSLPDYPEIIMKSIQLMDDKYAELHGPEDLARQLGISKFRLIKMFQKAIGITIVDYLTRVRIEKAIELLRNTDMNLDEIASCIGYANGNYFNKVFRMKIGTSPGRFRRSKSEPPIDHITFD